jgi:hypothetical protein
LAERVAGFDHKITKELKDMMHDPNQKSWVIKAANKKREKS